MPEPHLPIPALVRSPAYGVCHDIYENIYEDVYYKPPRDPSKYVQFCIRMARMCRRLVYD